MDVVKSNEKRLSASTDNSASMKVVKSNDCHGTIHGKTGHCSREILNGRLMAYSSWILVCFSISCSLLKLS